MASYRELIVWQRAMELVPAVYLVARNLPAQERYALSDQLRRSAVSVPANIAEGQGRQHRRQFMHALMIARGRLAEVDTLLEIAVRLGYVSIDLTRPANALVVSTGQLLERLIAHLKSKPDPPRRSQRTTGNG
jgi:four helix bundle protein